MARIKGISVTLQKKTLTGHDAFNNPVYSYAPVTVDNVLVAEPSSDDVTSALSLYGKKISYTLGIPKGDTNDWMDTEVSWTDAAGNTVKCRTFGFPVMGIEANVPGPWHKKIKCEVYG
mgnify:FL=1